MTTPDWRTALLRPDSVALVGVSDDPAKTSGRPLRFLRAAGFAGRVHLVNPGRDTVQGEPAAKSLSDLPEVPDHVFILTDADRALDALEDCVTLGVPVATILASGFSEAGAAGVAHQRRLDAIVAKGDTRVLGPSSIGIANLHAGLTLTANAAFAEPDLPVGGVFVGSHSGSLIGALLSRGARTGLGFAGLASVGGESDLAMGEICSATLDDPDVTGYLLFLETMRHADDLRDFALAAARRGKPVAAYKLGRSEAAAELAVSHTGALAGADEMADMFLDACGIARVDTFEGLLEIAPLLTRVTPRGDARPRRVGVVTTTGGGAAMAVDQVSLRGVDVVPPSRATRARLAEAGVDGGAGRIVDLTLAGTRYDVMSTALDVLRSAREFDCVLVTVGSSARFNPELAVQPAVDAIDTPGHPFAVFLVPDAPDAARRLAAAGIPAFQSPETCADALAAALHRRAPRSPAAPAPPEGGKLRALDEAEGYALLAGAGLPVAPYVALDAGAPVPSLPFDYPVVAKVLDAGIAHKSDAGGVVVGLPDAPSLSAAMQRIGTNVRSALPGLGADRILVQQMCRGLGEVLVGLRRDPDVGPAVVLAAGGIDAELYRDVVIRPAPVGPEEAREMIAALTAARRLDGWRGRPRGDLDALASAIAAMSRLALSTAPVVEEAEINPLLVRAEGEGVVALDAVVRLRDPDQPDTAARELNRQTGDTT
ncbi:CoA-binding domain-containing protein [Roseivivax marinus]|uniref:CoA-binding domain-containing protein n=1 Tax=Roseivivax marinus TaxID=1379903 RepID=W4HIR7_9RHOB|nr:acetate--CoA ligase family protein [Roseivivax marinus]ETW12041.1 CoA-binding domain-containing protein [Roseivivax marinus]